MFVHHMAYLYDDRYNRDVVCNIHQDHIEEAGGTLNSQPLSLSRWLNVQPQVLSMDHHDTISPDTKCCGMYVNSCDPSGFSLPTSVF